MSVELTAPTVPHRSTTKSGCRWIGPLLALPLLLATIAVPSSAHAGDSRFSVVEENDSILFDSDRYYTQGLQLNYLGPSVASTSGWASPFDFLSDHIGVFPSDGHIDRRYEVTFGQEIYTPSNIHRNHPDTDDRPYAGWLYGGIGLLQDTDRRQLDHLELQIGIIGPASYANEVQNDWHQFIGVQEAKGWNNQISNEPGVMLSYEHKWRFLQGFGDGYAVDAIPEVGGTLGNVMTYGEVSAMFRVGRNLEADYGPERMRPTLSGTNYFNSDALDGPFGFYFYAGAQGRAVARNIFLDGNTFEDSSSVDKKIFVGDLTGGLSLFWGNDVKFDTSVVYRTKEFNGQKDNEKYAGFNLTFGL